MNNFIQGFLKQAGHRPAFDEEQYIDRIENREFVMGKTKRDSVISNQVRGGVMPMAKTYKSQPYVKTANTPEEGDTSIPYGLRLKIRKRMNDNYNARDPVKDLPGHKPHDTEPTEPWPGPGVPRETEELPNPQDSNGPQSHQGGQGA